MNPTDPLSKAINALAERLNSANKLRLESINWNLLNIDWLKIVGFESLEKNVRVLELAGNYSYNNNEHASLFFLRNSRRAG